jgi:hypothetical protein
MRNSGFSAGKAFFAFFLIILFFWLFFVGSQDEQTQFRINNAAADAVGWR